VAATLPLVERWRWSGIIPGLEFPPLVTVAQERVVIASYDGQDTKIVTLEAQTGKLIWQSDYIRHLASLSILDKQINVSTIRYAQAFDLENGQELWQGAEQPPDKKGFLYIYPTDEGLQVYDFSQHHLYLLDPQTGSTSEEISYPNIFLKKDEIIYSGCTYGYHTPCLRAARATDNQNLWSWEFGGVVHLWPVFVEDRLMIINARGQLLAIDVATGRIVWRSTGLSFVTGLAQQDGLVYAIRRDAAIVGFNPETGQEVGWVEMTPNRTIEDDGGYVLHYAIAASDKYLAAYYGNSRELIVFEKVDSTHDPGK
jgi:outer membrane protein assembly factor BamB